jgi:hypothetical protein
MIDLKRDLLRLANLSAQKVVLARVHMPVFERHAESSRKSRRKSTKDTSSESVAEEVEEDSSKPSRWD